jgi:hypothetical protein
MHADETLEIPVNEPEERRLRRACDAFDLLLFRVWPHLEMRADVDEDTKRTLFQLFERAVLLRDSVGVAPAPEAGAEMLAASMLYQGRES